MDSKKPWQSKTIVLNAIAGICVAVLPFMPGAHVISDFIASNAGMIGGAWSIANIILRAVSKDKISLVD